MPFQGDVRSLALANVFQDLAMNEQSGTLRVRQEELAVHLWFDRGALRLVGFGKGEGPSIINGLLALGKVTPADVTGKATEPNVVRRLEKSKKITKMDVKQALEHQMTEHVCDAFTWNDAKYEFREGDPDDESFNLDHIDFEVRLVVDGLVMEAARRADEWKESTKQIISNAEILVCDPERLEGADPMTRKVGALLDGEASLRDIMEHTRLGRFTVTKVAAALLRAGAARPLKPAEALERAQKHAQAKRWHEALSIAAYGLEHERNNSALRVLVAKCHEELGDRESAIAELRLLASAQMEAKNLEGALATYGKIAALSPKETYAHEQIFEIQCALGRKVDALRSGEDLAAALQRAGLPEKALELYERLVALGGQEDSFLESIAEIARRQGDKKEAVKLYRRLLARALERKDTPGALDYCRTILRIEPGNEEIQGVKRDLESGAAEARRRRRRWMWLSTVAVLILSFAAVATAYELRARSRFAGVRKAIRDATSEKRWVDALAGYDQVIDTFPLSLTARELRDERGEIEEKLVSEELARAEERASRGEVTDALAGLHVALKPVRREDLKRKLHDAISLYKERVAGAQEQFRKQVADIVKGRKYDDLLKLDRVEAVPALRDCLSNPEKAVRDAAIRALARIQHPLALDVLVQALGDTEPTLRQLALEHLQKRTDQKFGLDRMAWENWLRVKDPIRAFLQPRTVKVPVGEPVVFDWKILNGSQADVEIELPADPAAGVRVDPDGLKIRRGREGWRVVHLKPGEYLGGVFELELPPTSPGMYTFSWLVPVKGRPDSLEATRVTIEVIAK